MQLRFKKVLLSAALLAHLSSSLPLIPHLPRGVPYSVVQVDGGPETPSTDIYATVTVDKPGSTLPPVTHTATITHTVQPSVSTTTTTTITSTTSYTSPSSTTPQTTITTTTPPPNTPTSTSTTSTTTSSQVTTTTTTTTSMPTTTTRATSTKHTSVTSQFPTAPTTTYPPISSHMPLPTGAANSPIPAASMTFHMPSLIPYAGA